MSNDRQLMVQGNVEVPAYLAALIQADPSIAAINEDALAGFRVGPSFPMISTKQGRFFIKKDGEVTPINQLEIDVVVIAAKGCLDKAYYIEKYDPSDTSESKAPDCMSRNGETPDPTSSHKQNTTCQGCPMNEFGSGTDAKGNPSKGKACADSKMLAIFAAGEVFGFKIPPNSLKIWGGYVKQLSQNGLFLPTVITRVGFAISDTPQFTFKYMGVLNEQQVRKVLELRAGDVVREITSTDAAPPKELPASPKDEPNPAKPAPAKSAPKKDPPKTASALPKEDPSTTTPAPNFTFNAASDDNQGSDDQGSDGGSASDDAVRNALGLDL